MTDQPADLLGALAKTAERGDPWHRPQTECPACEGSGAIQAGSFRGWRWVDCWDCSGSGNYNGPTPTTERDLSFDE